MKIEDEDCFFEILDEQKVESGVVFLSKGANKAWIILSISLFMFIILVIATVAMSTTNGFPVTRGRPNMVLGGRIHTMMGLLGIAIATLFPSSASSFCFTHFPIETTTFRSRRKGSLSTRVRTTILDASSGGSDTTPIVDQLLDIVEKKNDANENLDQDEIPELISKLSSNADDYILDENSMSSLFEPLVGYYNVSYTLTSRPNDNPVGGKWTRGLWSVKRTMQHVLPPLPVPSPSDKDSGASEELESIASKAVAQVVNAIRLELLWGFVGVWVLLRGDAVPLKLDPAYEKASDPIPEDEPKTKKPAPALLPNLSDRTVKAYFDRPRIGLSLSRRRKNAKPLFQRVLTLGPTSAVVLDTPYSDSRIRLGKGGTSGSQFVFRRLPETDQEAIEEWKWVIEDDNRTVGQSLTKKAIVLRLGVIGIAVGILSRVLQQRWIKLLAAAYGVVSCISIFGLIRSTGGIETEGDTYMKGKQ